MTTESGKRSLQHVLQDSLPKDGVEKLTADLHELSDTLSDLELVTAGVERVQRYALETSGRTVDDDFSQMREHEILAVNLDSPQQLVGFIERLTLALKSPQQQISGGETQELVGVLERLTLALKVPQQQIDGDGVKALPAEAGEDS